MKKQRKVRCTKRSGAQRTGGYAPHVRRSPNIFALPIGAVPQAAIFSQTDFETSNNLRVNCAVIDPYWLNMKLGD
jgi:hypothetical protein